MDVRPINREPPQYIVVDEDRKGLADGIAAFVWPWKVDDTFWLWYCRYHCTGLCEDVDAVKAWRVKHGLTERWRGPFTDPPVYDSPAAG